MVDVVVSFTDDRTLVEVGLQVPTKAGLPNQLYK